MRPDLQTDEFLDRLDAYLLGTQTDEEKTAFELLMRHDKELEKFVQFNSELHFSMQNADLFKVQSLIVQAADTENERVDNWINGTATIAEVETLEKDFAVNTDFGKWAKDKRDLVFVIENSDLQKVEKIISESKVQAPVLSVTTNNRQRKMPILRYMSAAAASIVLLLGAYMWLFSGSKSNDVFANYYKPYPAIDIKSKPSEFIANVLTTDDDVAKLQAAMDSYNAENYKQAIALFDELLEKNPLMTVAVFYKGCSLMSLKQFEQAVPLFESIVNTPIPVHQSQYKIESMWYLSLAYIKLKKTDKAHPLLQKLSTNPNVYRQQAATLLDDMKKM